MLIAVLTSSFTWHTKAEEPSASAAHILSTGGTGRSISQRSKSGNTKLKWRAARPRRHQSRVEPSRPPREERIVATETFPAVVRRAESRIETAPEPGVVALAPLLRPASNRLPLELIARQPGAFQPAEPMDPADMSDDGFSDFDEFDDRLDASQDPCAIERFHLIDEINIDIRVSGTSGTDVPVDCPIANRGQYQPRMWHETSFAWTASGLCHKPLYFEEVALERYGHSWAMPVQAVVSGAHFFATVPILPYKMGMDPPWECKYALGYYRPGNCAPFMIPPVPISLRGALLQAGVATGGVFLFP